MTRSIASIGLAVLSVVMSASNVAQERAEYRLDTGDVVRVIVFGHEDLSGEFEIDGTGRVSLPLVGDLSAGGLSLQELEAAITDSLRPDYLLNPRVNAEIATYRPFYIMGEVNAPGSYSYVNGMTVLNAVALAGGYTSRARRNEMEIRRGEDGTENVIVAAPETRVQPGDVIEVRERFF
ncbi:MAG TPA: polysaccharide biosynthesis/export family protein [Gammaproteobacteria bacterium]